MTSDDGAARTFGDRYVLGERLTAGETSEVWRAHDDIVSRQVALKIFFGSRAADTGWRERFRHQADRLVALSHPGIAKVYEHDESADEAWLAMAFITGTPLADTLAAGPLDAATALDVIGQTGFALQAAHDVGVVHGALRPANLMVRTDGSVAVVGFAVGTTDRPADDLRALGALAAECLDEPAVSTPDRASDVKQFVKWVTDPDRTAPPREAAEVGRTALALATALRGDGRSPVIPATTTTAMAETPAAEPRFDDAQRKQTRNRFIVLATIVVVGGAALLRFVGEGGGEVTVPSVVGLPLSQAKLELTKAGLRSEQNVPVSNAGATVISELPPPGTDVKAGSVIVLTVATGSSQ